MSGTLVFVHGTGVRGPTYASTLATIERQVRTRRLPVTVAGCYWGEAEGARLRAGGASVPGYAETGGAAPTEADETLALWSVLYTDPWYELRLLRHRPHGGPVPFGTLPPADLLRRTVREFVPSAELSALLGDAGLRASFDEAWAALRDAPELEQAIATAPADPLEHRRAIGRAVIAHTIVRAEQDRPASDGELRDALVQCLTAELRGYGLGVGEFLRGATVGVARSIANRRLRRTRGSITDGAAPLAGDVLRFLARGDGAREYLRRHVADAAPGPVHLLGHSLGGIMCVDMLVRDEVPGVTSLITVGSQAPFLYEIGALPGLDHPEPLPDHFPPWTNVFDRDDVLAYAGQGVFAPRIVDVEVDTGQPFPQCHSAYWTNGATWDAIRAVL